MSRVNGQALVNAQIEINRALFLYNANRNRDQYKGLLTLDEMSDEKVLEHARQAHESLGVVMEDGAVQGSLF